MKQLPFVGSLYSQKNSTFGPSITSSNYILTELEVETDRLALQVSLQNLDYETFALEEFTHIVVGIAFQVKLNDLQYTGCVKWCHVYKDVVQIVEANDAREGESLNIVSCGIIPKGSFLPIVLKNISETKLDQVDRKVLDQIFQTSLEKLIEKLKFIKASRYLSNNDYQIITDIETICVKTRDNSVNKINKLLKELTASDWSKNLFQLMKVIETFKNLIKSKKVICKSVKKCVIQRAELCGSLGGKDIKYFALSDCSFFQTVCNKYSELYLLMFCKDFVDKDRKQFDIVKEEFLKLKNEHKNSVFMLIEIDLLIGEISFTPCETVICHFKNGVGYIISINGTNATNDSNEFSYRLVGDITDFKPRDSELDEVGDNKKNYVLFSRSDIEELGRILKWSQLFIPCPRLYCSQDPVLWNCKYCNETLYFSFDSYIYCTCGRIELSKCKFVCASNCKDTHTADEVFVINQLKPTNSLNLLIFGQNDEDINIWKNNFYFYLSSLNYITEEQLTVEQLQNFISNEKIKNNKTKSPDLLSLNTTDKVYNLVSAPGVCPNLTIPELKDAQIVLESLEKEMEHVHGICIIINMVDTSIKFKFKYFIEEILTYFHKDAVKNILFCVSSPEDKKEITKLALEEVLKEINAPLVNGSIYFIESEVIGEVESTKLSDTKLHEAVLNKWRATQSETERLIE